MVMPTHKRTTERFFEEEACSGEDEEDGIEMGVLSEFGKLPRATLLTERGLASLFQRHAASVKRAVERNELPPPTKLFGKPVWTLGSILAHIESRLEREEQDRADLEAKTARHRA